MSPRCGFGFVTLGFPDGSASAVHASQELSVWVWVAPPGRPPSLPNDADADEANRTGGTPLREKDVTDPIARIVREHLARLGVAAVDHGPLIADLQSAMVDVVRRAQTEEYHR